MCSNEERVQKCLLMSLRIIIYQNYSAMRVLCTFKILGEWYMFKKYVMRVWKAKRQ